MSYKFNLIKLSRMQVRMPGKTDLEPRLVILIKEGDPLTVERGSETVERRLLHRGQQAMHTA